MNEKERICLMNKFRERFLTVEFLDEQENLIDLLSWTNTQNKQNDHE